MCVMDFAYDFIPHGVEQEVEEEPKNVNMNNEMKSAGGNYSNNNNYNDLQSQKYNQVNHNQVSHQPPQNQVYTQVQNQSPIVPVSIENQSKVKQNPPSVIQSQGQLSQVNTAHLNELSEINSKKKVLSRYVEVITKVVYTYEDGSKKEVVEKEEHTFKN